MRPPASFSTIAVVIPTHNRPQTLARSLESVARQTLPPAEVIIVDDGSQPPVSQDVLAHLPPTVRSRLVRNETPLGANAARNSGILAAQSDYVAFLDDDDEFRGNKIESLSRYIQCNPTDVIHHLATIIFDNENVSYDTKISFNFSFKDLLISNCLGGTPVACVRRLLLLELGGFDNALPALQDWDLWLRIAKHGASFGPLDAPLVVCHHNTAISSITKSIDNLARALTMINAKYPTELAQLTVPERLKRARTDAARLAFRHAMMGQRLAAALTYLGAAATTRSPSLIPVAMLALVGVKSLARARSIASRSR